MPEFREETRAGEETLELREGQVSGHKPAPTIPPPPAVRVRPEAAQSTPPAPCSGSRAERGGDEVRITG